MGENKNVRDEGPDLDAKSPEAGEPSTPAEDAHAGAGAADAPATDPEAADSPAAPADGPSLRALEDAEAPVQAFDGFFEAPAGATDDAAAPAPENQAADKPTTEPEPAADPATPAAPVRRAPKGLRIGVAGAKRSRGAKRDGRPAKSSASQTRASRPAGHGAAGAPAPKVSVGSSLEAEDKEDKAKARKGALFMTAILGVYFVWIVLSGQMGDVLGAIGKADYGWLFAGFFFMCVMRPFLGGLAYVFAAYIDPACPVGVRDCMSVEETGVLFGNLTPMNSGAIPAQIYRLTKTGLDVGESGAFQFSRFIMYQAGEVIVGAILLLLRFNFFLENYGDLVMLNIVVFTIQTLQAAGLLAVCLMPRLVIRVGNWALRLAKRHRWLRDEKIDEYSRTVNTQVMEFAQVFRTSIRHHGSMALSWAVTVGMMVCFYSVPWFVLKALGGDADFLTCLAAGSMVQMIGNSVPLPGGTGGNEAGFAFFFGPIFGAQATAGFVLWRLITFFIPTALALPVSQWRSRSHRSIYQRWNAFVANRGSQHATVRLGSQGKGRETKAAKPAHRRRRRTDVATFVDKRKDDR